jgi:hypothetical protein
MLGQQREKRPRRQRPSKLGRVEKPDLTRQTTAVGVVGRVALALVGARMTPTTHASIAERDDIEVGLNGRATRPAASPAS